MSFVEQYLYYPAIGILCLYIVVLLLQMARLYLLDDEEINPIPDSDLPKISVLVAARNEEQNIWRCLSALNNMDYSKNRIEVLLGNDQSEDRTLEIAEAFAQKHPNFKVVNITTTLGKARGKANVLAQLAHQATGDYFLITDADVAVNKKWARAIMPYFEEKTAIVSGTTIVSDEGTMGRMQEIDWMYFMGLLWGAYGYGLNCTAVGNNMAIRKEAYWDVGGYENLDFSITEDYKLYKEVRKKGWKTINVLNADVINRSRAIHRLRVLLSQRKRWLIGARELPFYWWILFGIFGLFTPAIILIALVNVKLALIFYLIKLSFQTITITGLQDKMHLDKNMDYLFTYELYSLGITLITQIYFFLPLKLQWKNRSYKV